jgi:phosphatidylglycerophosphatase C
VNDSAPTSVPPPATHQDDPLAIFDLDGTLIRGDSFLPFLVSFAWRRRRFLPILVLPFYVALYACRVLSAQRAKERLIRAFVRGETTEEIARHAERFTSDWVQKRFRQEVLALLRKHQQAGHRVVLISASPDLYVPCIARSLNVTETICTRVAIANGVYLGSLASPNCKGEQKVVMLQSYLGRSKAPAGSCAYGDSRSDLALIHWVGRGYRVGRTIVPVVPEECGDQAT